MRLEPISTAQNFKGLFTDKTIQNGGTWKMEYRPYSWENPKIVSPKANYFDAKNTKMANKTPIDLTKPILPDNEEIFVKATEKTPAISKDILDTISYYRYSSGKGNDNITEARPLNLEESLKVSVKKHEKFREMKLDRMAKLKKEISNGIDAVKEQIENCKNVVENGDKIRDFYVSKYREQRNDAFNSLQKTNGLQSEKVTEYMDIAESVENLDKHVKNMRKELKLIKRKKAAGDLIDISVRHQGDANKVLFDEATKLAKNPKELQNTTKLVLLAHKSVPLKELVTEWIERVRTSGRFANSEQALKHFAEDLTHIVDRRISFRI